MSPRTRYAAVVFATIGALAVPATPASGAPEGPIIGADRPDAIAGNYIVTLKETTRMASLDMTATSRDLAGRYRGTIGHVYTTALRGFSVQMGQTAAKRLAADPAVALVEADGYARITGSQSPATWGLDRVDQRNLPLNNTFTYNQSGQGVHAYVIDTGIQNLHGQFDGRWSVGIDTVGDGKNGMDCNGHGTHVAGTLGGTTWGVAKQVTIHAVRVLGCGGSGAWSGVIAGVDWVTAHAIKPAVANMSLGGSANTSVDNAVNNSINSGVSYAIAAGNNNINTCTFSPARVAAANTVAATTKTDARAAWSNWGTCVDIFAPGDAITSDSHTATPTSTVKSGTSMASPHVAGAIALYLQANPNAAPAQVTNAVMAAATSGVVTNPGTGSPNRLLYSVFAGGTPPPTAKFTYSCNNTTLKCTFDGSGSFDSNGSISKWSWTFGDGATATGKTTTHTYSSGGFYTITLTVTDNSGDTGAAAQTFRVGPNRPPTANFTPSCIKHPTNGTVQCYFHGWNGSSDPDGEIVGHAWNFGDGTTGTGATGNHKYATSGTYNVRLTVTDNEGATGTITKPITI